MLKYRVLHILPNFGMGGAERMAAHLLMRLNRERFDVAAVSLFDRRGTDLEEQLKHTGVPVWYLGKRLGFDPRMYIRLARVFRAFRPDVVHTHRYVLRYLIPLFLTHQAKIWIHTVHNLAEREVDELGKWVHRMAFRKGVVPVSIALEVSRSLSRVYGLKEMPLIANGIPVFRYAPRNEVRKAWRTQEGFDEGVLFVCIARMSPQKDHRTLLRAFAWATAQRSDLHLLLVGDGPLRPDLEKWAEYLRIQEKVRFLGIRPDVPEILAAADVFVLSSQWEGDPLSVKEAMAAGKPVIAASVGGVPEVVEDGVSGLLVSPGDTKALAAAMLRLAGDADLRSRMGQEALQRAREKFDVGIMVKKYEDLYESLLQKNQANS